MKRSVAVGVVGIALAVGGVGISWSLAAEESDPAVVEPNAEKRAILEQEKLLADANAALAADPTKVKEIAESKAAEHVQHVKELDAMEQPEVQWPTGIFDDPEAPAPGMVFLGTNRWVGKIGDGYVAIYAGRSGEDPTRGRIMAVWSDSDVAGYSLDLPGTGALKATAATGSELSLTDEQGDLHVLDVLEAKWVE